jgi:hypothetical protein
MAKLYLLAILLRYSAVTARPGPPWRAALTAVPPFWNVCLGRQLTRQTRPSLSRFVTWHSGPAGICINPQGRSTTYQGKPPTRNHYQDARPFPCIRVRQVSTTSQFSTPAGFNSQTTAISAPICYATASGQVLCLQISTEPCDVGCNTFRLARYVAPAAIVCTVLFPTDAQQSTDVCELPFWMQPLRICSKPSQSSERKSIRRREPEKLREAK